MPLEAAKGSGDGAFQESEKEKKRRAMESYRPTNNRLTIRITRAYTGPTLLLLLLKVDTNSRNHDDRLWHHDSCLEPTTRIAALVHRLLRLDIHAASLERGIHYLFGTRRGCLEWINFDVLVRRLDDSHPEEEPFRARLTRKMSKQANNYRKKQRAKKKEGNGRSGTFGSKLAAG